MTKERNPQEPAYSLPDDSRRSDCPIACALDILGDKWTLVVIRDMFLGSKTYSDFENGLEKIPTNILADRLKRLEAVGILRKERYQERPARYAYQLTARGRSLGPLLAELAKWAIQHLDYAGKPDADSAKIAYVKERFLGQPGGA